MGLFSLHRRHASLVWLLFWTFSSSFVSSYRYGDLIETEWVWEGSIRTDAVRAHRPTFGISSAAVPVPWHDDSTAHVSLVFCQGLLPTSTIPRTNRRGEHLSKVLIELMASGGGSGSSNNIHSATVRHTEYEASPEDPETIWVEYQWKTDATSLATIRLRGGMFVMMGMTLAVLVILLFHLCTVVDAQDAAAAMAAQQSNNSSQSNTSQAYVQKKW